MSISARRVIRAAQFGVASLLGSIELTACVGANPPDLVTHRYYETDLPPEELVHRADNAAFFNETLPGRKGPLGAPGGAATVGQMGVDTPLVAGLPPRAESPHPSA